MKKELLEILACPDDMNHSLELFEFTTKEEDIFEGMILCPNCYGFFQ